MGIGPPGAGSLPGPSALVRPDLSASPTPPRPTFFCPSMVRQAGPLGGEGAVRHIGVIGGSACHPHHFQNGIQVSPVILIE